MFILVASGCSALGSYSRVQINSNMYRRCGGSCFSHEGLVQTSSSLQHLCRLSVQSSVHYKVFLLVFESRHSTAPPFIFTLFHLLSTPLCRLRSMDQGFQCCWPGARECETFGSEPEHSCCFFFKRCNCKQVFVDQIPLSASA